MGAMDRLERLPQRITDANGDPVSGAKVYFYEAGTTTPKDTFDGIGLASVNANPIICDAGGLLGNVFLDEGAYKIVAKTAEDVTLWTHDNAVQGLDAGIAEALEASSISAFRLNIGGRADINAAIDYDVKSAADETARTTQMNLAVAAGASERRTVYMPVANPYIGSNSWTFNGPIEVFSDSRILGDMHSTTLLNFSGCNGIIMPSADDGRPTTEFTMTGVHIRGDDHIGTSDHIGIEVRVSRGMRLQDVTVERFTDCISFDGAQFNNDQSGNTFSRMNNILVAQNDPWNQSNLYPRYGVRFFSSTGSSQTQGVYFNGRIYSEITAKGPTTSTSGTTHVREGHGRFLARAAGIRVFREDVAGGTYEQLTHVASSPGATEYTLVDQDGDAIAPGDDIRNTMANDITSVTVSTGAAATTARNIRVYWVDPKGLTGLSIEGSSALYGEFEVSGYQTNVDMDGPANTVDIRYGQISDLNVRFGPSSVDSSVYFGEHSGFSILTKVDKSAATSGRIQYLRGSRSFQRDLVTATFTTASLTPTAVDLDGGNDYIGYLITEHPGPRQVRAELEVAVVGAANSFALLTLQVSHDSGTTFTTLSDTTVDVGFKGRVVLEAFDELLENTDAQVSATFRYQVTVAVSDTAATAYGVGTPPATTLGASETTGATAITVAEREHYFTGQPLRVTQDDGTIHQSLIASGGSAVAHPYSATTGAGDLTIATGLTDDAASGLAVTGMVLDSWIGVKDVNPS